MTEGIAMESLTWDLAEAAAALKVSARTLKRMQARDELPPEVLVRLRGRRLFSAAALRAWVAAGCPAPARRRR